MKNMLENLRGRYLKGTYGKRCKQTCDSQCNAGTYYLTDGLEVPLVSYNIAKGTYKPILGIRLA